ncbi:glutamate--cysteine ligase [Candidatus Seongchinamella marina]|uniref:glutamate--cysteine ligase n=1 Tax=Candidatus Seongchinamella marina TaxID=2518990 RepID=UPI002431DF71|nr:glutamate--cysteine ligase [Candidatus Seongchinamella marina]
MPSHLQKQLESLTGSQQTSLLCSIGRGIEKESLRITPDGALAQTPHPRALGSALTHGSITTDYSEALLEFITPVDTGIYSSLKTLEDIHQYVYNQMPEEMLWCASMPCFLGEDKDIPVAKYGSSNVARMKTVYRYGLGHRYGRVMQTIAGIHYNFSMPQAYWDQAWAEAGQPGELQDYISERYLGLIRNFRRYSWLLIYLFGASPAICGSFLRNHDQHGLEPFGDGHSLYLPHGTALRMSDLGYNSNAQKGLRICYNSLANYVETLRAAIMQPHPDYAHLSSGESGEYQQLNDSLLQIENEFYSPIRPKRVTLSGETPLHALTENGIEYIEVRCVDVNPFSPVGIDAEQIRFLDTFLLYCLLEESPACTEQEQDCMAANMNAVVNRGREPGLELSSCNGSSLMSDWANSLLSDMQDISKALDNAHQSKAYGESLQVQSAKIADSELTPSARVLREMREQGKPFFRLALSYSQLWADHFRQQPADAEKTAHYAAEAELSLTAQQAVEAADEVSFEQYLANFYGQYETLPKP